MGPLPRAKTAPSRNQIRRSERMNVMDIRKTSAMLYLDGVHVADEECALVNRTPAPASRSRFGVRTRVAP